MRVVSDGNNTEMKRGGPTSQGVGVGAVRHECAIQSGSIS